jgi:hypothetical protein
MRAIWGRMHFMKKLALLILSLLMMLVLVSPALADTDDYASGEAKKNFMIAKITISSAT